MPAAVIAMLAISLFECVLILPAHLGHESGRIESVIRWILTPFRPLLWLIQKAIRVHPVPAQSDSSVLHAESSDIA